MAVRPDRRSYGGDGMVNRLRDGIVWAALAAAAATGAFADVSGTANLTANQTLNLDTGSTGSSGGDLLWNGSTLAPQGAPPPGSFPGGAAPVFTAPLPSRLLPPSRPFWARRPLPWRRTIF